MLELKDAVCLMKINAWIRIVVLNIGVMTFVTFVRIFLATANR